MTDPPEMKELDAVTARLVKVDRERDQLRDRAAVLVVAALKQHVSPTEVANRSPYSPAYVRKLARENGIPPAAPGLKPRPRGRSTGGTP